LRRAESVRKALVAGGLGTDFVAARGLASTRPTSANATEAGRTANRRVEIVIAGGAIGETPLWDRAYPITRR
jgi:flagellar motor protein MotB